MAATAAAAIGGGLLSGLGQGIGAYSQYQMMLEMQKRGQNFMLDMLNKQQVFQMQYLTERFRLAGLATPVNMMRNNSSPGVEPNPATGQPHSFNQALTGSSRDQSAQVSIPTESKATDTSVEHDLFDEAPTLTPQPYTNSSFPGAKVRDVSSDGTMSSKNGVLSLVNANEGTTTPQASITSQASEIPQASTSSMRDNIFGKQDFGPDSISISSQDAAEALNPTVDQHSNIPEPTMWMDSKAYVPPANAMPNVKLLSTTTV